jgi:hypothetical protein
MSKKLLFAASVAAGLNAGAALAEDNHYHHDGLHFRHPLVTESPAPETKIRLDYIYTNEPGEHGEDGAYVQSLNIVGEYAFNDSLGVEVALPYSFRDPKGDDSNTDNLGNLKVALKYASHVFADSGLLVGGGLELGLPTGSTRKEIGSSHIIEIEPFIDFGYQLSDFELIGVLGAGFPQNENTDDETDLELEWSTSLVHKTNHELSLILEASGEHVKGGEEDGAHIINLTPGFTYKLPDTNLLLGAGVSFPVTDDKEIYAQPIISLFCHF